MPAFAILATPHQALFLIMKIFSFNPVFLSLLHVALLVSCMWLSPIQAAPIQMGDTGIVRLGTYHYHNQEIAPRPSVPGSPKTYSVSSY